MIGLATARMRDVLDRVHEFLDRHSDYELMDNGATQGNDAAELMDELAELFGTGNGGPPHKDPEITRLLVETFLAGQSCSYPKTTAERIAEIQVVLADFDHIHWRGRRAEPEEPKNPKAPF